MSDKVNDGGPAFPMPGVYDASRDVIAPVNDYYDAGGASLRDYFAAKALEGLLANPARCSGAEVEVGKTAYARLVAKVSFEFADAMLYARGAQ